VKTRYRPTKKEIETIHLALEQVLGLIIVIEEEELGVHYLYTTK